MAQNSSKFVHYAGALFLLVAAVFLGGQLMNPWYKNVQAQITNEPYSRTFTVAGEAKVTDKPDMAVVSLSVVSQASTVKEVVADNNTKMNKVIDAVKKLGVDPKDIMTSQYNLRPEYDDSKNADNRTFPVPPSSSGKLVGYHLDQQITVKVRDLEKVEDVLDQATQSGANQIGQLYFDVDDTSELKKKAREMAFEAAKQKAKEMAAAAGVKLVRVVTFSEGGEYYPYANVTRSFDAISAEGAVMAPSIEPGSKELQVSVSVTYEIE